MGLMEKQKRLPERQQEGHCVQVILARAAKLPSQKTSATFAYAPERLGANERAEMEALMESNAKFKASVDLLKKERRWLAPGFGFTPR